MGRAQLVTGSSPHCSLAYGKSSERERAERMAARNHISEAQFTVAREVASRVYAGQMKSSDGVALLAGEHGLNETSALDFIRDYKNLMEGRVLKRAMSAAAMRHFIQSIADEHGSQRLTLALDALRAHIDYRPNQLMREVLLQFEPMVSAPSTLSEHERAFAEAVRRSLNDNGAARDRRLARAKRLPTAITVQTTVFVRNEDVVAAVLLRAAGMCERCKREAPFKRARDSTPYLEVHHRVPLARGGEDSVENAAALCPNCHRQAHYG